jgi:hypothetical protein
LRDDLKEATRHALKWTREALFAPEASSWAIFLLNQVEDRFGEAIKIGKAALRRMPAAVVVANNTAYSLALAGDGEQAKNFLRRVEEGGMFELATRGLVWAVRGDTQEANRFYDLAEDLAKRDDPANGSQLVNLHRRLIAVVGPEATDALSRPVTLPAHWDDFPSLVLCLRMLKRRGAPLDDITIEGGGSLPKVIEPRDSGLTGT